MSRQAQPTQPDQDRSQYGAGVVVCLAKFSEHIHPQILQRWIDHGTEESMAIEMVMNGASDHFMDLDRERAPAALIELADLTLEMGHGFSDRKWTKDDWNHARDLWREACLALDRQLHTPPDWGLW